MHNPDIPVFDDAHIYIIGEVETGQRIDRYIVSLLSDVSRSSVQQMIAEGNVLVNGHTSKSGYLLRTGDEVQIVQSTPDAYSGNATPRLLPLDIIYEDEDLLVINKVAGMVVHPAPGHLDDTLVNAVLAYCPELLGVEGLRPGIVHRLDRDTSGLIIVAKNARTQAALIEQMKQHEIVKRYQALVEGIVSVDSGSIDAPIGRDPRHRQQMAVTATGSREARTHFRVLERFQRHTLLLLQLETGRTHQIRVHLKAIGHPVVGDSVYGSGNTRGSHSLKRQFLHAFQLIFTHPSTGQLLELEAPLPEDLKVVLLQKSSL
ncbi:MAG TPA: RluA family pseudouridine synthase [Ktedonobacter sp.]|nr:RluA family pseudouridine synthase [Ktedonobacter sp.]